MKLDKMTLEPRPRQILGKLLLTKKLESVIVLIDDPTKGVSKFVLVEAAGTDVEKDGIRPGDLVLPRMINNVWFKGGSVHYALVALDDVCVIVRDPDLTQLLDKEGKPLVFDAEGKLLDSNSASAAETAA